MDDINVAAFSTGGYGVADGFHTLTTNTAMTETRLYDAFVYGHGSTGTHTSYGYLAGYDRKLMSSVCVCM